jgi:ABC-type transporter Mla subunit MlaD
MQEGFSRKEQLVGAFLLVLIVFTIVTLLVIAQGKGWFQPQNTYFVEFKQGYNLHQGSLVKMFNTEIGKVSDLGITQAMGSPQVKVTIRVFREYAGLGKKPQLSKCLKGLQEVNLQGRLGHSLKRFEKLAQSSPS